MPNNGKMCNSVELSQMEEKDKNLSFWGQPTKTGKTEIKQIRYIAHTLELTHTLHNSGTQIMCRVVLLRGNPFATVSHGFI